MSGPLSPAAPSRLRKAAKAGAGRFVTACASDTRRQVMMLSDWTRAARQVQWISTCPGIRKGPLLGPGLLRWCAPKPDQGLRQAERSFEQKPANPVSAPDKSGKPDFADILDRNRPQPTAEPCSVADDNISTLPARLPAGKLRLLAKSDPEPATRRKTPVWGSRSTDKTATPKAALQPDWRSALTERAANRLCPPSGSAGAKPNIASAWVQQIQAPAASLPLIQKARAGRDAPETVVPSKRSQKTVQDDPSGTGAKPTSANLDDVQTHPEGHKPLASPLASVNDVPETPATAGFVADPKDKPIQEADKLSAGQDGKAKIDPLTFQTLSPPPHISPVALPPQPDFARASVAPRHEPVRPNPASAAISDEPLSELPAPAPNVPDTPGFGHDDLRQALADLLRDEARRHGIDV